MVAQPLEIGGNRFIDVTDPDTEETFRFYEVEYSVACAMDGRKDVAGLIRWAKDELGLEPKQSEVELVIHTLADLGYLSGEDVELGAPGPAQVAAPTPALPDTSDVELGASGGTPSQRAPSVSSGEDLELGTAGKSSTPAPPAGGGSVTMGWDVPDVSALVGEGTLGPSGAAADDDDGGELELDAEMPPPPDAPAEPRPTLKPSGDAASDEDGPTQIPEPATDFENDDVSVDLSDHLSIGTSDVKEAVRQSKVMQAVDVPSDLAAAIDEDAAAMDAEPTKEVAVPVQPPKVAAPKLEEPAAKPDKDKPAKPAAKDDKAAAAAVEAPKAAAEEKKSSVGLLLLILLLAVGGGGAYWYFKIYKADDAAAPPPAKTTAQQTTPKKPPAPPPVVLVEAEPIVETVAAASDGKLEWIVDSGAQVDEGDVVVKLKGVSAVERSLVRPRRKLEEYSAKLEEAKEANNEGAIRRYTAKVDEKAQLVADGEERLAKLTVTSPQRGTVGKLIASVGATVKPGDPILEIAGERGLAATFPAGKRSFEAGADCEIAAAKTPETRIDCTVTAVEGGKVTVRVAADVGLAAGEAVVLK